MGGRGSGSKIMRQEATRRLESSIKEIETGGVPAGTFWSSDSEFMDIYNQMSNAVDNEEFKFTQASENQFHRYYRYYNDGDLPGWARSRYDLTRDGRWGRELNNEGQAELERRTALAVIKEWKRFQKQGRRNT